MSVKIIFFVLTGIILMYGALADVNHEELRQKCAIHSPGKNFDICVMMGHGILNEKGEWDKKKFEDVLKETRPDIPAKVVTEMMKCVDEGTGETRLQKAENFFKCTDKMPESDRNFV